MPVFLTAFTTVVLVCVWPTLAAGQSLADLARQEAARRQAVAAPGKVFTNADLKPVPIPLPAAPVAPTATSGATLTPPPSLEQAGATPPAADAAGATPLNATGEKKDEKYWRQRLTSARDNIARSQILEQALQARIAALATDFVNRDDPVQRAQIEADRLRAITELERVKKEVAANQTELTAIAEEARKAGVPPGWVR